MYEALVCVMNTVAREEKEDVVMFAPQKEAGGLSLATESEWHLLFAINRLRMYV
ncbi:hypothetical protein GCM10007086_03430 [Photobacterium aphoticum]|nr:hypothetical protein GCM10007086_03430 [Photobacterium aphoticum]